MNNFGGPRRFAMLILSFALTLTNFSIAWAGPSTQLATPTGVTAIAMSNTSFKVMFNRVSNDDGGYLVSLYLANGTPVIGFTSSSTSNGNSNNGNNNNNGNDNSDNNGNNNSNGNVQATSITDTIGGLSPSTTYRVTITAQGQGKYTNSAPSSPITVATYPSQVVLTITSVSGNYGTPLILKSIGAVSSDPVVYTLSGVGTATGCTITNAILTATSLGTCLVTVTQVTSSNYLEASSTPTVITFAPAIQATLIITTTSGSVNAPLSLATTGGAGNGTVTYAVTGSGSATGCIVNGSALSVATFGTCLITATKAANGTYASISSAQTAITMAALNQSALSVTPNSGVINTPIALAAAGGSGNGAVSFKATSNSTATSCTVTGNVISATNAGLCMVTATKASDGIYGPITSLEAAITVSAPASAPAVVPVISPAVVPFINPVIPDVVVPVEPDIPVAYISEPVTAPVDTSVETNVKVSVETPHSSPLDVSIDIPPGSVAEGSTVSIAPMSAFVDANANSALISVKVSDATGAPVTHFDQPLILNIGKKTAASAPVYSEDGTTWSLIPLLTGTTLPDGMAEGYYIDDSGSVVILTHHLTIFGQKRFQSSVSASSSASSLMTGSHIRVTGYGGSSTRPIVYASITPSICTVSQWGLLVGVAGGECKVTAKRRGNDAYLPQTSAPISITIYRKAQRDLSLFTFVPTLSKGSVAELLTSGGSGHGEKSYQSLTPNVCHVLSDGHVIADAVGQCTVQGIKAGTDFYMEATSPPFTFSVR